MTFTKCEDGLKIYIQQEDIISVEQMEGYSIIHLIYGCYEVMQTVEQIFKTQNDTYKFYDN